MTTLDQPYAQVLRVRERPGVPPGQDQQVQQLREGQGVFRVFLTLILVYLRASFLRWLAVPTGSVLCLDAGLSTLWLMSTPQSQAWPCCNWRRAGPCAQVCIKSKADGSNGGVCVAPSDNQFVIGKWVDGWADSKFICGCYTDK